MTWTKYTSFQKVRAVFRNTKHLTVHGTLVMKGLDESGLVFTYAFPDNHHLMAHRRALSRASVFLVLILLRNLVQPQTHLRLLRNGSDTQQADDTMLAAVNPWLSKETSLFKALNC